MSDEKRIKIVIDINEEYFKYIKDIPKCYRLPAHKVIANGTPLEKHDAELLDKIRAEIENKISSDTDNIVLTQKFNEGLITSIAIIDKYRKGDKE